MEIDKKNRKARIMLHMIMPNQVSGPNNAAKLIGNSFLSKNYKFGYLIQNRHAGGKINFWLIKDLMKQVKDFNPDIIHLSGLQSSGFHAVLAARFCGKRNILLVVRGSSIDAINISNKMKFVFGRIVEPLTMKLSKKVYTVCDAMARREYIKKNAKDRLIATIHNSAPNIDLTKINKYDLRNKLNIKDESILVAIVGRIVYDKGVTFVSDAIKKITDKRIKFIFIGDEPNELGLADRLVSEIDEERVFLMGKQDNVMPILNECDIFLLATLHENLSNALLEACSLGLAVIATNVGGNPEVIEHDYNGILIPPACSESICSALMQLVNNNVKIIRLGENAQKVIRNNFSQNLLLKKVEKVYNTLLLEY
jgi:glycosyltransferase involved in cell wall biosynthesis